VVHDSKLPAPGGPVGANRGQHRTKTDEVVEVLREAIASGQVKPGASLTMQSIAKGFGYSITPVREAFRILQAEGILPYQPYRATHLNDLSVEQVRAICEFRVLVDGQAVRLATVNMTPTILQRLRFLQGEMEVAYQNHDDESIVRTNTDWHYALYGACGNPYLIDATHRVWHLYPLHTITAIAGRAEQSINEHRSIMQAIEEGDAEQAKQLMEVHLRSTAASIEEFINNQGGQESVESK
jgi:DNA-binding GntR family transcriptional regulator